MALLVCLMDRAKGIVFIVIFDHTRFDHVFQPVEKRCPRRHSGRALFVTRRFGCRGAIKTGQSCAIKTGRMRPASTLALPEAEWASRVTLLQRKIGLCGDAT
jgi:hypothetical protein